MLRLTQGLSAGREERVMEQVRLRMETIVDPRLKGVGLLARFLAITLPLIGGRNGEVVGEPRVILGALLPYGGCSEEEVGSALDELEAAGEVELVNRDGLSLVRLLRLSERVGVRARPQRRMEPAPTSHEGRKERCAPAATFPSQPPDNGVGSAALGSAVLGSAVLGSATAGTCLGQSVEGGSEKAVESSGDGESQSVGGGAHIISKVYVENCESPLGEAHSPSLSSFSPPDPPLSSNLSPTSLFIINKKKKKLSPPCSPPPVSRIAEQKESDDGGSEENVAQARDLIRHFAEKWTREPPDPWGDTSVIKDTEVRAELEAIIESRKAERAAKERDNPPYEIILEAMNNEWGTRYRLSNQFRKLVNGRWSEGYRLGDFKAVFRNRWEKWGGDERMRSYLRPTTVLRPSNFESYWNDATAYKAKPEPPSIYRDLD